MRNTRYHVAALVLLVCACSAGETAVTLGVGGTLGDTGGAVGNGGNATETGGTVSNGGTPELSGGSATDSGGATNNSAPDGGSAAGGASSTNAKATSGGTRSSGGRNGTGGTKSAGGNATSIGTTSTGGTASVGGSSATSSTPAVVGSCARAVGSCSEPAVNVTDVSLGIAVTAYGGEGDTDPFPMAIAAMTSGGSRLAWLGTDKKVYVAQLDCDDKLVGSPFSFPALDLQDIIADDNGGVVLLTRDATNGGTDNCGTGTLCGGTSSPCRTMWMVRFNSSGTVEWETQVTNLSATLAGYQNGARFIWWYQHHGRLAFSGSNYAAIFGVAITVNNGSCVDIHEGDRLQLVSSAGALVSAGSLEVGMSHAWTSRILWDPRTNKFAASDATDNNCRIAIPTGGVTIASGTCDGTLFNGDIVPSTGAGYWNAWSQGGTIRLEHFTTGASDKTVTAGSSQHPHLVSYGPNNMLLAWQSGTALAAQVRSATDAATVGSQFTIAVSDHDYQAFKAYADGSVAYPAAGSNNKAIKIARVMPCN